MKPSAYLLNTARGPLVDAGALLEAIDSGGLAGAGLDVFDPEPPPADSPLRNHPRIIATPHIASGTAESFNRMETRALEQVLAFFRDQPVAHLVNPQVLDRN
jgi:D-3-phosphoglycerate dehydrogenase